MSLTHYYRSSITQLLHPHVRPLSARSVVTMSKAIICVALLALLCTGKVTCSTSERCQRLIVQECRTCKQQQMGQSVTCANQPSPADQLWLIEFSIQPKTLTREQRQPRCSARARHAIHAAQQQAGHCSFSCICQYPPPQGKNAQSGRLSSCVTAKILYGGPRLCPDLCSRLGSTTHATPRPLGPPCAPAPLLPCAAAYAQNPFDKIAQAAKSVTDTVDKTVNGTRNAVNTVTNGEQSVEQFLLRGGVGAVPADNPLGRCSLPLVCRARPACL